MELYIQNICINMKELAIKVINQIKAGDLVLNDLHELLVQYGKYKTNSPTVELSADKIILGLNKEDKDLIDVERKQTINELLNLGIRQIIDDLGINTVTTKECKIIYV